MLIVRLAKILMIAAVGAFAFMATYDNIVDFGSNYEFVRHVLSMVFLAGLLAFTVFFSFELDSPFSGLIRLDPDSFRSALVEFGHIP